MEDRRFLRKATSVSIFRDARANKLNLRFLAVTTDFQTRRGMLGIERGGSSMTGKDLVLHTNNAIRHLTTKYAGSPQKEDMPVLRHHIRKRFMF